MNFDLTSEQKELMEAVRRFVDVRVDPRMGAIEEANQFPDDLICEIAELGLFGISIPETYGGSG